MITDNVLCFLNFSGNVLLSFFYLSCYRNTKNTEKAASLFLRCAMALVFLLLIMGEVYGPGKHSALLLMFLAAVSSFLVYLVSAALDVMKRKQTCCVFLPPLFAAVVVARFLPGSTVSDEKIISLIFLFFSFAMVSKAVYLLFFSKLPEARAYVPSVIYFLQGLYLLQYPLLPHEFFSFRAFFAVNAFFDFMNFALLLYLFCYLEESINGKVKERYKKTMESIDEGVLLLLHDRIIHANAAAASCFKLTPETMIGKSMLELSPPKQGEGMDSRDALHAQIKKLQNEGKVKFEWVHWAADGEPFVSDINMVKAAENGRAGAIAVLRDITRQKQTDEFMRISRTVFDNAFEGFYVLNSKGEFEFVNRGFSEITGYSLEDLKGRNEAEFRAGIPDNHIYEKIFMEVMKNSKWEGELWNRKKNGNLILCRIAVAVLRNKGNEPEKFVGTILDITDYQRTLEKLQQFMNYDPLTRLINRDSFLAVLDNELKTLKDEIAFFDIDINNFRYINDTYGHSTGDALLLEFSTRLRNFLSGIKMICRYSADEFLLFFHNTEKESALIANVIDKILGTVKNPFLIEGDEILLTVSIGIVSVRQGKGVTANSVVHNGNAALHDAKKKGNNQYSFYSQGMQNRASRKLKFENAFRGAINNNEVIPFFQGKYEALSGKLMGMETLARWVGAGKTVILPSEFLPLAEKTNLIYPMTEKLMEAACRWTAGWNGSNNDNLRVAINLSAMHFRNYDITGAVEKILSLTGLETKNLELEITESAFLDNTAGVFRTFKILKENGIHISLDDFGTGYSSFSYLKNLPIDSLKIDKSFISDVESSALSRKLLKSIFNIARDLDLETVAEGIENSRQKEILQELGCDMLQGYHFSRPLSPENFRTYLEKERMLKREQ